MSEFRGWRVWRVKDWRTGLLMAAIADFEWPGPVLEVPPDDMSNLPDSGGFHSHRSQEQTLEYGCHIGPSRHMIAYGQVRHFGVVCEYERGFRSSHVLIERLWTDPVWDTAFSVRLAERYQCDVTAWNSKMWPKEHMASGGNLNGSGGGGVYAAFGQQQANYANYQNALQQQLLAYGGGGFGFNSNAKVGP